MAEYLITLTPQEPWFFGGERVFKHPDASRPKTKTAGYYIRSQETPSQTTLFGALRYLMLEQKKQGNWRLSQDDEARIGPVSYDLTGQKQDFGKIKGISPLYLMDSIGFFYIPAPMDHRDGSSAYRPFTDYKYFETNHGRRCYPVGYDEKRAFDGGWLRLGRDTVTIHTDLFESVEQVGVNLDASQDGFFKRECMRFKQNGFCFAFFAELDLDEPPKDQLVFLGQGRRAFYAACSKQAQPDLKAVFDHNIAYAQSPVYAEDLQALYACCEFICTKEPVRLRKFMTKYNAPGRFALDKNLLQLIPPGGVFRLNDPQEFKRLTENSQAKTAGFNQMIYGKELSE